jgi:hypothetical protein
MTRNFFRQLKADKVRYLLISGQATVLYGAATFSEDLDIWLCPQAANVRRFAQSLRALHARYYKLTPPLTSAYLRKGHGFHFALPAEGGRIWYLDVMGAPPRSPAFNAAWRRSVRMQTPWGPVPVVGVPDLVELKKTQRLEDYAVISRLVLALMSGPGLPTDLSAKALAKEEALTPAGLKPDRRLGRWAVQNIISPAMLAELIRLQPWVMTAPGHGLTDLRAFGSKVEQGKEPGQALEKRIEREMQARMAGHQAADRKYWRRIIAELKSLRAQGRLMPEGKMTAGG